MAQSQTEDHLPDPASLPERVPMTEFTGRLRAVVEREGPFLTCYLPVGTFHDLDISRAAIAASDLPERDRTDIRDLLDEAELRARNGQGVDAMVAIVRAADGTTFAEYYPEPIAEALIDVSPLPRLTPVLEAEQRLRHHVLAVISETGLDLMTFPRHGEPTLHSVSETDPDRITHLLAETVKATDTKLVLLAGATDVVSTIRHQLQFDVPIETVVDVLSLHDGNVDEIGVAAVRLVSNDQAVRTVETLRGWKFERAHGSAPADLVTSIHALRAGNARLLLVNDDMDDQRQVWVGPAATDLAIDLEDASHAIGASDLLAVRMVDGLVRSALLQGVPVQIVPSLPDSTLPGGVGVLVDVDTDRLSR